MDPWSHGNLNRGKRLLVSARGSLGKEFNVSVPQFPHMNKIFKYIFRERLVGKNNLFFFLSHFWCLFLLHRITESLNH